ncbi:hypothetical protein RclHR1_19100002 [Rhizophagus clarus]|uniref:DDE Tnp4 domain-containing protein n=1 Tax=Rhizophagus clarus TaxID=94130 RepID=A0A2Z6R467_9GLOM|nr:hypothetical protein RclHR1_19100002 [Rhizophagus clarus]
MLGLVALNEVCYLEPRIYNIAKSQYWYHNILPSYDDIRFKKIMRIFSENFKKLVNLLSFHSIFKQIIYDVGWLGSVHDAKVYRNFHFYLNRTSLIKGNDFLIGDSAYPLSPFLIKPFSKPNENQTEFNHIFSLYRIVVEHLFGRIKNRFGGIKKISVKKISTAVNIIDCSIILHNFLELNNDIWVDNENNDNSEEDSNESDNYYNNNEESLKRAGEAKRNWIMSKLFTTL